VIEAGSLEYAHARLCARFGDRPDALAWRRVEMTRELDAMLDVARATPLGAWIVRIAPDTDVHAVEREMRAHWNERVAAIAAWMPSKWRASIEWCGLVMDLPVLQHVARGGTAPRAWRDDPLHGALANDVARGKTERAVFLAATRANPDRIASLWRAEWTRRLPPHRGRSSLLAETVRLIAEHLTAFREPRHVDGWALRRALHARLSRLFRRATLDPAEAFIFLALSALDFERLRGEILRRVAFPRLPLAP